MSASTFYASKSCEQPSAAIGKHPFDSAVEWWDSLPRGVLVGTAVISHVTNGGVGAIAYEWHLTDVRRVQELRKPERQPQPVWFRPF